MALYHVTETEGLTTGHIELNRAPVGMGRPSETGIEGFYLSDDPDYYIDRAAVASRAQVYTIDVSTRAKWISDNEPAPDFILNALRDQMAGKEEAISQLADQMEEHNTLLSEDVGATVEQYLTTHSVASSDIRALLERALEDYPGDAWAEIEALESKVDWLRTDEWGPLDTRNLIGMVQKESKIPPGFLAELLADNDIAGLKWGFDDHTIFCVLVNDPSLIRISGVTRHAGADMNHDTETTLLPEVMAAEAQIKDAEDQGRVILFHSSSDDPDLVENIRSGGLDGEIGPWRKEILEHSGWEQDDINQQLSDPDNLAVFLSTEPNWMAVIASRSEGQPAKAKVAIDDLVNHAVLNVCMIDPEEQPIYTPELDEMGCVTGKSIQVSVNDNEPVRGEKIHWMPVGAETKDIYVQAPVDPENIILLEGDAAVQFAARNFPQTLMAQVTDPEKVKARAGQFDDSLRESLLKGREASPEQHLTRNR